MTNIEGVDPEKVESLDVAVVHGQYRMRGGAERVAEEMARTFDAPLYVGYSDPETVDESPDDIECRSLFGESFWNKFRDRYLVRYLHSMISFQRRPELDEYDVIIESGVEPGWYVPKSEQVVIRYIYSPEIRSMNDLFHESMATNDYLGIIQGLVHRAAYNRYLDYVDRFVILSETVRRRVQRYWRVDSDRIDIVYPSVDTDRHAEVNPDTDDEYYLTYSRLYPHKRVKEIVEAFANHPDKKLIVGGDGPMREEIEEVATENVEVRGYISEEEKLELLSGAQAVIFNAVSEDFGLIPPESFASGTPVIGVNEGYTRHQILDGKNGITYDAGNLSDAITRFAEGGVSWGEEQLMEWGERYSEEQFREGMEDAVRKAVSEAQEQATPDDY